MKIGRRGFLKSTTAAGIGAAAAGFPIAKALEAAIDYGATVVFERLPKQAYDNKSLETKISETETHFVPYLDDGWYIQYSVNSAVANSDKNIENLIGLGFNDKNIKVWPGLGQTKLYIGKYASMIEAVQQAERLKGLIDEVGIVESRYHNISWNLTANLKNIQPNIPPIKYDGNLATPYANLIERLTDKYNQKAASEGKSTIRSEFIKALQLVENSESDPNAISHQLRVVSRDGKRKILVESKDNPLAYGLFMLTPLTMKHTDLDFKDRFNPEKNAWAAINYFGELFNRNKGNLELTYAAYNAGQSNVDKYNGVPPFLETRRHVARVMGKLNVMN